MRHQNRCFAIALAILSLQALGCTSSDSGSAAAGGLARAFRNSNVTVPAGAQVTVRLSQTITSETAHSGDRWTGTVTAPITVDGKEVVPAGATVEGVVVASEEARRGNRARLELGVRSVEIGERRESLHARSEAVVAGSPQARNLGAIAGGAAAGAIIGGATQDKPGTGAIIGGAIATGAVAASKGYQVVLQGGTVMTFAVTRNEVIDLMAFDFSGPLRARLGAPRS